MNDTPRRSLVKTISWRITGSGATFGISYMISGNFAVTGKYSHGSTDNQHYLVLCT